MITKKCKKVLLYSLVTALAAVSVCSFAAITDALFVNASVNTDAILSTSLSEVYSRGYVLSIPQASMSVTGETYVASHKVTSPSGAEYTGDSLRLSETGEYTIDYFVEKDGNLYTDTMQFIVENSASSLFTGDSYVTTEVSGLPEYVTEEKNKTGYEQGVKITVKNGGSNTVRYNQIVDLREIDFQFKKDAQDTTKSFLEMAFTPSSNTMKETSDFQIILTDVYDETNYLVIDMIAGDKQSVYPNGNFCTAAPNGLYDPIGWSWGNGTPEKEYTNFGCVISADFYGGYGDNPMEVASFSLDMKDLGLYCLRNRGYGGWFPLHTHFEDSEVVGNNVWSGFTTGEVYVSFHVDGMSMPQTSFTVFKIGNQVFEDFDDASRNVRFKTLYGDFDQKSDYLIAGENREFEIFETLAYSDWYGLYSNVSARVYFGTGSEMTEIATKDGKFSVAKAGKYTIVYTARSEKSLAQKEIVITAKSAYDEEDLLQYVVADGIVAETRVGERIVIPQGEIKGGIGKVDYAVRVTVNNDEEIVLDKSGKIPAFEVIKSGKYVVEYTLTDELGTVYTKTQEIDVEADEVPTITLPSLQKTFLKGQTYVFPAANATYAGADGAKNVTSTVWIDGEDYTEKPYKVVSDSFTVTYKAVLTENESVYAEETVICSAKTIGTGKEYALSYFTAEGGNLSVDEKGVKVSVDTNIPVYFNGKISVNNLEIATNVADKTKFSGFRYTIVDSVSSNEEVVVSVRNKQMKTTKIPAFYIGDEYTSNTAGAFDGSSANSFKYKFDAKTSVFTDESGTNVGTVKYYADGRVFQGFTSGYVYVKIELLEMTAPSTFYIHNIAGQSFNSGLVSDNRAPLISYSVPISSQMIKAVGDTLTLPAIQAYDVLGEVAQLKIKVTYGSETIYEGDGKTENGVALTRLGRYVVRFTAIDTNGNTNAESCYVTVVEYTPPVLSLHNQITVAKVGMQVNLAQATVTDDSKVTLYVCIMNVEGSMDTYLAEEMKAYTFDQVGTYRIYYYAVDEYSNFSVASYNVEVK